MIQCLKCKAWVENKDITTGGCVHCNTYTGNRMTNKCSVNYVCWGSKETCKYWVEGLVPFNTHYYIVCKWYLEGICTCKEARKEAVSEN